MILLYPPPLSPTLKKTLHLLIFLLLFLDDFWLINESRHFALIDDVELTSFKWFCAVFFYVFKRYNTTRTWGSFKVSHCDIII